MGKVVPFARMHSAKRESFVSTVTSQAKGQSQRVQSTPGERAVALRAEKLLVEAAEMLTDSEHERVPWILEDCIDLLRQSEKLSDSENDQAQRAPVARAKNELGLKDPRHMLNTSAELTSLIRTK